MPPLNFILQALYEEMESFLKLNAYTAPDTVGKRYVSIWKGLDKLLQDLPHGPTAYKVMFKEIDGGTESQTEYVHGADDRAKLFAELQSRVAKTRDLILPLL